MSTMTVEPIFGNGWTDGRTDMPQPSCFEIDAEEDQGVISGQITASNDTNLIGATFQATARHEDASDCLFNCQIEFGDETKLTGYCKIC